MSTVEARKRGEPEREVRFGLVLYGGVSLAVYIYGVAYEFQRLVRASSGRETNAWTGVLEDAGVSASVDIVSGASAGGINGLLLGKALVEGGDLRAVRSLWLDEADLDRMLREEGESAPASLLRSARFRQLIEAGLARMDQTSLKQALVPAFDLFVSGTRLRPWLREFRTDLDGLVQTRDYRKSFHLKFRQPVVGFLPGHDRRRKRAWRRMLGYDRNDFRPERNVSLAEVAQATSAFPVAFEPVPIEVGSDNEHLFDPREPRSGYFSDGGILHNKPFTETISTIFTRAADRPVDRWLVSVEPDPERDAPATSGEPAPPVTEVVSKALTGIPRYQSIAADLDRFEQRRRRVSEARLRLRKIDEVLIARLDEDARRSLRRQALEASPYLVERRASVVADLTERITAGWPAEAVPQREAVVSNTLLATGESGSEERRGEPGPLEHADAGFQQRRVYRILERIRPVLAEPSLHSGLREELAAAQRGLWTQFERIEAARWSLFGGDGWWLDPRAFDGDRADATARHLVERLSGALGPIASDVGAICEELDKIWSDARPEDARRPFALLFDYFELWDTHLLPMAELNDLGSRDTIRLARISPADAQFIQRSADEKLAGDALGHFGGFLDRGWRCNDLLWGRLDAAETIARMLFRSRGEEQRTEWAIRRAQRAICEDELDESPADYRHHMENAYAGGQTLADLPIDTRGDLVVRGATVFRNMLRGLRDDEAVPGALRRLFGTIGWILASVLLVVRWPARAAWGRDRGVGRMIDLAILFAALWGVATVLLVAIGAIGPTSTLWSLVGLALAAFAVRGLLRLFFGRRRSRREPGGAAP